jgi:PAS domain S-box-containing protein
MSTNTERARGSINELLKTKKDELWVATSAGIEVHKPNGEFSFYDVINGELLYMVTGLAEDSDGHIWISSGGSFDGAYEWDGKSWKRYSKGTPLQGKRIHKIRKDERGRLCFLSVWPSDPDDTTSTLGVDVFEHDKFVEHWGTETGLPSKQVYSFATGKDGARWFGSIAGLSRWKEGQWTHWISDTAKFLAPRKIPFPMYRIFALTIDLEGNVWCADRMRGLTCITPNDSVTWFTTSDGLINDDVWDVRGDDAGRLWITTSGGLSCYQKGMWTSINSREGLLSSQLWPVLPDKNKIYIGTSGVGICVLDTKELPQRPPILVLNEAAKQDASVLFSWKPYGFWGEPASENILSRYRLDNGEWSKWGTATSKTVKELKPGNHIVQVQSLGMLGRLHELGESRFFVVEEKLLRNPLFLIPTFGLAFLALALGVGSIMRKRRDDARLRASEAQFRAITETTASAIFIYDAKKIFFANTSAELLTGFSNEELLRMAFSDLIHPDSVAEFVASSIAYRPAARDRYRCEVRLRQRSGDERWIDHTEGIILYRGVRATVGTGFDVSQRKSAEEKILINQEELRSLAAELSTTEERERRRMATFLHDMVGQSLALCKMKLSELQRSRSAFPIESQLKDIRTYLDQSIQNTRSLTFELSPPILQELGLVAAIESLAEEMQRQHKIEFACSDDGEEKPLSLELRTLLFHAVRELLVNVVKHSHAHRVTISTQCENDSLVINVRDDGIGIDAENLRLRQTPQSGFGLFNIRERLTHLGGSLDLAPLATGGTEVTLRAPIHATDYALEKKFNE